MKSIIRKALNKLGYEIIAAKPSHLVLWALRGSKKTVVDYFKAENIHLLLNRIGYTGRMALKF